MAHPATGKLPYHGRSALLCTGLLVYLFMVISHGDASGTRQQPLHEEYMPIKKLKIAAMHENGRLLKLMHEEQKISPVNGL